MASTGAHPGDAAASRTPIIIWVLVALLALRAVISPVGAVIFAFPLGWPTGYIVGTLLLLAGIAYAIVAWRLPRGERLIWIAALVLPVVHQAGLAAFDFARAGTIPSEDYPFIGLTVVMVVLLLVPSTRRFFNR